LKRMLMANDVQHHPTCKVHVERMDGFMRYAVRPIQVWLFV
jgi:hypothetical protein